MMNFAQIGIINSFTPAVDGGSSFHADYQTYLDRLTTLGYSLPSAGQQVKGNQLVQDLDDAGIWDLLDVFYVFAIDGDSDAATVNWKTPTSFQGTKVNSPTFTTNIGFNGNGSTSYVNLNWAPNQGVNFQQNEAGFGGYVHTSSSNSSIVFGSTNSFGASSVSLLPLNFGNASYWISQINSSPASGANASSVGFYHIRRTASNAVALYKNGSPLDTDTTTSAARNALSIYVGAMNSNGAINAPTNRQIGMFWAGASMSGLEADFYTAWNTYFTSL